jgi:hypothetical protein
VHTLFLNIQARLTISVRLICFVMLSWCLFSFPFWDNLIATSTVKLNITLVSVRPRKTVAEYEGLDTSLLSLWDKGWLTLHYPIFSLHQYIPHSKFIANCLMGCVLQTYSRIQISQGIHARSKTKITQNNVLNINYIVIID